jgi:hypothetical protein
VCAAAAYFGWGLVAFGAAPQVPEGLAVRQIAPGGKAAGNPGERGATYYALEARITRVTTRFPGVTAVAERMADGDIQARLRDAGGNEIARLRVDRVDGIRDAVQYIVGADPAVQALGEPSVRMTMEWANRQAYSFYRDGIDEAGTDLEWRGDLARRRRGPARDVAREIEQIDTDWADGLSASTSRRANAAHDGLKGRRLRGEAFVTRLTKHGVRAGGANYFAADRVFLWDLPGLSNGWIGPEHLQRFGGWPFTPDLAWMNMQVIAFHHFKTLIDQQRFVAGRQPGVLERLGRLLVPVVEANEPGCDNLHWLDGTVYRYCCDMHDACYEKYGCSSSSWWKVWSSWNCNRCNAWVIFCFEGGGTVPWLAE